MFDRITFDPKTMAGRACIRGMPITVSRILAWIAAGRSVARILEETPELQLEDVQQALEYAAELAREK